MAHELKLFAKKTRNWLSAKVCCIYLQDGLKEFILDTIGGLSKATVKIGVLPWRLCRICESGGMCWIDTFKTLHTILAFEDEFPSDKWYCPNRVLTHLLLSLQDHHRIYKPSKEQFVPPSVEFDFLYRNKRDKFAILVKEENQRRRIQFLGIFEANVDLECWVSNTFQLAKCFLPAGYHDFASVNDIGLCGMLTIIGNCDLFADFLSRERLRLQEVDRFVRQLFVTKTELLDNFEQWYVHALPLFITLLNEKKYLRYDTNARNAVAKLVKVIQVNGQMEDEEIGRVLSASNGTVFSFHGPSFERKCTGNGDCSVVEIRDMPRGETIGSEERFPWLHRVLMASSNVCLYCKTEKAFLVFDSFKLRSFVDWRHLESSSIQEGIRTKREFAILGGEVRSFCSNSPLTKPLFDYLDDLVVKAQSIEKPATSISYHLQNGVQNKRITQSKPNLTTFNSVVDLKQTRSKVMACTGDDTPSCVIAPADSKHDQSLQNPVQTMTDEEKRQIHMQATEENNMRSELAVSHTRGPFVNQSQRPELRPGYSCSNETHDNFRSSDNAIRSAISPPEMFRPEIPRPETHQCNIQSHHNQPSILGNNSAHSLFNSYEGNGLPTTVPTPFKNTPKYSKYVDENERFRSYARWIHINPSPTQLSKAGFFFTSTADLVRCYQCGIGLKDFSSTDDPLKEHVKHSSQCQHLLLYFGTMSALENYKKSMQDLEPGAIRQKQLAEFRERSLQGPPPRQYRIRNEAYNTYELRLTSFEKWPEHIAQRPPILAEAGLYYTGIDDHVRCFACDGGLRRWDPEDDPWIEHCRWFPACPFAREQKGDEFIALVQASADQNIDELGATSGISTNDYVGGVNLHITDPDIKRSIEEKRKICTEDMGFSNDMFSFAVNELRQQGNIKPCMEDIVVAIEVIKDRNQQHSTEIPINVNRNDTSTEELLEENKRLKDMLTCFICQNNPVNALFLPCTHHRLCLDCSHDLKECPVCLRPIREKIKTFMG